MKNTRAIVLLFIANSVSGFAQGISMIAIPWYFINIISKGELFGVIYAVVTITGLFWGLYCGVLIDKYDRKKIMLITNVLGSIILLLIALSGFMYGSIPPMLVALIFAVTFFIYNIHYPNLYAFAQEITAQKDYGRITSYLEIQGQTTNAAAGGIAMILFLGVQSGPAEVFGLSFNIPFTIKKWALHEIFLLDGITYFLAFTILYFLRYTSIAARSTETGTIIKRLTSGLKFLNKNRILFIFGNASYSIFVIILVAYPILFPGYIKNFLGAEANVYAGTELFFSIGAIGAGIFIRWLFVRWTTVFSIIVMMVITAASMYVYMFNTYIFIFYILIFILGVTNAGTRIMRVTYIFHYVPNDIIGRTTSVFQVINVLFRLVFITMFTLPFFTKDLNIIYPFFILGTFAMISAIVLMGYYKRMANYKGQD